MEARPVAVRQVAVRPGTDTTAPRISWIASSGSGITNGSGNLASGTVRLNLNFNESVTVSGTPTIALNDGGTATYVSGSGSKDLVFNYVVQPGQNTPNLMVAAYNGFGGVKDPSGNSVNLGGAPTWVTNGTLAIDTKAAAVSSIAASGNGINGGNGSLRSGAVQLTVGFSEAVKVSGTPTLTLNDGGVAKYVSGAGTKNLVFSYKIEPGQRTSDLSVSSYNLGGVKDLAGNSVNVSGAPAKPRPGRSPSARDRGASRRKAEQASRLSFRAARTRWAMPATISPPRRVRRQRATLCWPDGWPCGANTQRPASRRPRVRPGGCLPAMPPPRP